MCLAGGHALVRGKLEREWIVVAAVGLLAVLAAVLLPLEDWSKPLEEAIARTDLAAGLLIFFAFSVIATLALVPAWIFAIAAGAVFGLGWGLAAAMVSAFASALAAFLLARYVMRDRLERAARENATFKAVDAAVAKEGWKVVALLRMSPVMPSGFKSYFLGLTRVRLTDYAAANWSLFVLGAAATVALALLVGRRARKKLRL